jgi:hypothetical protein
MIASLEFYEALPCFSRGRPEGFVRRLLRNSILRLDQTICNHVFCPSGHKASSNNSLPPLKNNLSSSYPSIIEWLLSVLYFDNFPPCCKRNNSSRFFSAHGPNYPLFSPLPGELLRPFLLSFDARVQLVKIVLNIRSLRNTLS